MVPAGDTSAIVPAPSSLGLALHRDVADSVPALLKASCEACDADQLQAGAGKDRNLVVGILDDADIHQLRKLSDVLVALILERRGRGIRRGGAFELNVDLRNLLHGRIGGLNVVGDPLLCLGTQLLDARSSSS